MEKKTIVIIMVVGSVGLLAGYVGPLVFADSGQTTANQAPMTNQISEEDKPNESVIDALTLLKKEISSQGMDNVSVYVSPKENYQVVTFEPVESPKVAFDRVAIEYAGVVEDNPSIGSLVIRTSNAEAVVPKNTAQLYNNDTVNKEAYKETVSIRLYD